MLAHYAVRWLMHSAARHGKKAHWTYLLLKIFIYFDAPNLSLALFPPAKQEKRKQWFAQLLQNASRLKCIKSRQRKNPRMVKRRGTAFASHKR